MLRCCLLIAGLLLVPMANATNVYMLGKFNIQGTTYAQVVFFSHKDITTLEACEKEVMYGRTGQWQHYGHLVNKVAGMSIAVNYICRSAPVKLSTWQARERYDIVYEVDFRDNGLKLVQHDTYAACVGHFRQQKVQESYEYFCAKANQRIQPAQ